MGQREAPDVRPSDRVCRHAPRSGRLQPLGGPGALGYLLYRRQAVRRVVLPMIGRQTFATRAGDDDRLLAELPRLLDRIDA